MPSATVTSSGTGAYSIPSLPPGNYDVTVKMASFKTFHVTDLQLTVGQVLPLNVQLEPGAVTEEVQVRADQIPDVDLETSQVSNLVDERAIKDLPLITRNPYELVLAVSRNFADQQPAGRHLRQRFARTKQQFPAGRSGQQRHVGTRRISGGVLERRIRIPPRNFASSPTTSMPNMAATPAPSSTW